MAIINTYRRFSRLSWILSWLFCFSGLFVQVLSGSCNTLPNCDVCTNPSICTTCSSTYGLTSSQPPTCQPCNSNSGCTFCTNTSLCDVCSSPTVGPDKKGVGTCSPCAPNCASCAVNGSEVCDTCAAQFFLNINLTCTSCPAHCSSCSRNENINVTTMTCHGCINDNTAYFLNWTSNMCQPCSDVNCGSCYVYSENEDYCDTCKTGYYPNARSRIGKNACIRCASNCKTCSDGLPSNCGDCIPGFGFIRGTQFCAPCSVSFCQNFLNYQNICTQCLRGYQLDYALQVCTACNVSFCQWCIYNICYECQSGYELDYALNVCTVLGASSSTATILTTTTNRPFSSSATSTAVSQQRASSSVSQQASFSSVSPQASLFSVSPQASFSSVSPQASLSSVSQQASLSSGDQTLHTMSATSSGGTTRGTSTSVTQVPITEPTVLPLSYPPTSNNAVVIALAVLLGLCLFGYIVMILVIVKQRQHLRRSQLELNALQSSHPHNEPPYENEPELSANPYLRPNLTPNPNLRPTKYQTLDFTREKTGDFSNDGSSSVIYENAEENINQ